MMHDEFKAKALTALRARGFGNPEAFVTDDQIGARGTKNGKTYEVSFKRGTYEDLSMRQVVAAIHQWGKS